MNRPTDWAVLDLDADPTPGDPFSVRQLARRFLEFAADVEYARGQVASLSAGGVVESWLGDAGNAFREEIAEFPGQLQKLETSYRMAGNALTAYEPILAAAQVQADRALAQGRDARSRRDSAQNLLGSAQAVLTADAAALADLASVSSTYAADAPAARPGAGGTGHPEPGRGTGKARPGAKHRPGRAGRSGRGSPARVIREGNARGRRQGLRADDS